MLKGTTVVPVPSLGVPKLLLVVTGMVEGVVVVMVVWVTLSLLRSASVKLSSVALPSVTCTPGTVIGTQLKHTRKANTLSFLVENTLCVECMTNTGTTF